MGRAAAHFRTVGRKPAGMEALFHGCGGHDNAQRKDSLATETRNLDSFILRFRASRPTGNISGAPCDGKSSRAITSAALTAWSATWESNSVGLSP